ncbi:MAG: hotdog domain-containing protein [Pseudoxanthomonas sp.]
METSTAALDDAAFFAANSREHDYPLATLQFNIQFFRPCRGGMLTAIGTLTRPSGRCSGVPLPGKKSDIDESLCTGSACAGRLQ